MEASPESSKLDQLGIETYDFGDLRFSEVPINIHKKTANVGFVMNLFHVSPGDSMGMHNQPPWG